MISYISPFFKKYFFSRDFLIIFTADSGYCPFLANVIASSSRSVAKICILYSETLDPSISDKAIAIL